MGFEGDISEETGLTLTDDADEAQEAGAVVIWRAGINGSLIGVDGVSFAYAVRYPASAE